MGTPWPDGHVGDAPFKPGMAMSLEIPYCRRSSPGGFSVEDLILVMATGCENFNTLSRRLVSPAG